MAAPDWPSALRQRAASSAAPHRDRIGVEEVHIPPLVTVVEAQEVSVGTKKLAGQRHRLQYLSSLIAQHLR